MNARSLFEAAPYRACASRTAPTVIAAVYSNRGRIPHMNSVVLSVILAFFLHHSIAGVYDNTRQVTIDGVVAEFHFVNPHPFVLVDAKSERWKLELDNLSELV